MYDIHLTLSGLQKERRALNLYNSVEKVYWIRRRNRKYFLNKNDNYF